MVIFIPNCAIKRLVTLVSLDIAKCKLQKRKPSKGTLSLRTHLLRELDTDSDLTKQEKTYLKLQLMESVISIKPNI